MPMQVRELYCPSHFGNVYEVALPHEMRELLSEAAHWGFNRYTDWFDTVDLANVYAPGDGHYNLPEAMWDHAFGSYRVAADLGLDLGLVVTPNHVFRDQVTPANAAVGSDRYFGQLVCPSKPGVPELILDNYRRLFNDFTRRELRLVSLSLGAYDYGGCACDACRPWIVSFGKLAVAIGELAREHFGEIDLDLWGWWWSDEDHQAFSAWADGGAPERFHGFNHYIPYGARHYPPRRIPAGAAERAFVHIGYGNQRGHDVYGHFGPTVAPERLEETVAYLRERGAEGFLAYSEGPFDELNKALLGGLGAGRYASAEEVLRAYAERHFGDADTAGWAAFFRDFADVETADPQSMRSRWVRLAAGQEPTWRLRQWEGKLQLLEAHAAGRDARDDAARRAAGERFRDTKQRLCRDIWKRGLQRHIFRFDWLLPDWYRQVMPPENRAPERAGADSEA